MASSRPSAGLVKNYAGKRRVILIVGESRRTASAIPGNGNRYDIPYDNKLLYQHCLIHIIEIKDYPYLVESGLDQALLHSIFTLQSSWCLQQKPKIGFYI